MKLRNKILIGLGLIGVPAIVATSTFVAVSAASKNNSNASSNNSNNQESKIKDNTELYSSKVVATNKTQFDPSLSIDGWNEYNSLDSNPYSANYNTIFNKINNSIVENDLNNYLANLSSSSINNKFNINIQDVSLIQSKQQSWNIEIDFKIYNKQNLNYFYNLPNTNLKMLIRPYEVKDSKLIISGGIAYKFNVLDNGNGTCNLVANYEFDNATWEVNGIKPYAIENFSFDDYSYSLNTVVENVPISNNYLTIKNFANDKLSTLSINDIKNDVDNTYKTYLASIEKMLDPLQNVLQSFVTNYNNKESSIDFLKNNANDIGTLVDEVVYITTKNKMNLSPIISLVLSDATLYEIISSEDKIKPLFSLLDGLMPGISGTIESFLQNINSQEDIEGLIEQLKPMILGLFNDELIANQVSLLLDDLKTKGLLSTILNNRSAIVSILESFAIVDEQLVNVLRPLLDIADAQNKTLSDIIVDLIKSSDGTVFYIKELMKTLNFALNPSMESLLDQAIFNNPNLTAQKLVNAINALANPRVSNSTSAQVVRYKEWYDGMIKEFGFNNEGSYDPITKDINLAYKVKFTYTSNIYFNIMEILKILPNNLDLNGTSLPLSTLIPLMPDWLGILKDDYFSFTTNLQDKLEYDVIKYNNADVLSWQAYSKMVVDMNMPQSVKSLWDTTSSGTGDIIINLTKGVFYHVYNTYDYFRPFSTSLNNTQIQNYDYNMKTNEAVFVKEILEADKTALVESYNSQTSNINYLDENGNTSSFIIQKKSWFQSEKKIYKTVTQTSFDFESTLKNFIDFTHYTTGLHVAFNNNRIIDQFDVKILGVKVATVPNVNASNITVFAPYSTYTNNGSYSNSWTLSLG